ncbi:TetR/AcrR family transcriptional regulator [Pseudonocardia sp. CA-107938]|uniref:TetR/AcrR family transcriptional regulator n=1 Tax=Pseudonocardia sp. CA-107938 TaxID=3240021 RepID=UPI003D90C0B3
MRSPSNDEILDAADALFYARGVQTVGMDELRTASGASLKRLYQEFPSKEALVAAWLRRRDAAWRARLAAHVDRVEEPRARVLAVFGWLAEWFAEPDFRGCAFVNAFGELGATSAAVAAEARRHKELFAGYVRDLVTAAGGSPSLSTQVFVLAEGAIVTAAVLGTPDAARSAREAAAVLLDGSGGAARFR